MRADSFGRVSMRAIFVADRAPVGHDALVRGEAVMGDIQPERASVPKLGVWLASLAHLPCTVS